jgi:membrane protease YdiL (CAAX protease family)
VRQYALRRIEQWVENVSPIFEFLVVVLIAFGYFSLGSLFYLLFESRKVLITGGSLISLVVYEIAVLLVLGWFLRKRGWTLARFGVKLCWKSILMGFGLIPTVHITYVLIWITLISLFPEIQALSQNKSLSTSGVDLWIAILFSFINPVFEEIFVCGYIIHFFKKSKNLWNVILISIFIRTIYHLYQPIQGIVAIISIGLIFGLFYAKTNRLWSVIVAHSFFDLVGFLSLSNS